MAERSNGQRTLTGASGLVVGGAGFVGSNLTRLLLDAGIGHVTVVDNLLSSEATNVPVDTRVSLHIGSITDPRILDGLRTDYDYVWHLACYHGNQSSIADPMADHANNLLPSLVLFDYLTRRQDPTAVVYAAAGCAVAEKVYGQPRATSEDAPVSLFHDSPYSISKIAGELYGNYFWKQNGLPLVKARFQNVYGPGEILGAGQWRGTPATIWRNVVPTFIWKALHGEPLRLDHGGHTSRDFIYVEDLCRGLIACALRGRPGEAYNLASGVETTILQLAETILAETRSTAVLEVADARSWDNSGNRYGDPAKSDRELAFRANVPLAEGIQRTVTWTRHNENFIDACIHRHLPALERYTGGIY